jgi:integrase
MASLSSDNRGNRTIQFMDVDRKRRSVRLGKMSKRQAEAVKRHIEHLVAAKIAGGAPPDETSRWLAGLDAKLYERLAGVELVARRESATLGAFIGGYIEVRVDVKDTTRVKYENTRNKLVEFFGEGRPLRSITKGDAAEFRLHLIGQGLVENTVRKNIGIAKVFFNAAVDRELIPSNPFSPLVSSVRANKDKFYFITREEAERVLGACPDAEWRLIFALCRYGGLRCPSEVLALKWQHVNWEQGRLQVQPPKTEHHEGKESRHVPLFPELRPYLEDGFEVAEPGSEYVVTRYRKRESNLRTQLGRIAARAGITLWPAPFQNLRSTRETELADRFPIKVVTEWMGNSELVASQHYLQVTNDHFAAALKPTDCSALQKAVQQMHATHCTPLQPHLPAQEKTRDLQGFAGACSSVQMSRMLPDGLEPSTHGLRVRCSAS